MYIKRNYGFWMTFNWSREPFLYGTLYATIICAIYFFTKRDISLSWQPISLLGVAVAFYLGFKNNSSYDRAWEARKIWGSIVNASRSFAGQLLAFMQHPDAQRLHQERRQLIFRHIAWLTALRFQLRLSREWEHTEDRVRGLYSPTVCEDYFHRLDQEVMNLISEEEFLRYKPKANIAAQLLATQLVELQRLRDEGFFEDFRHMELQRTVTFLYDHQGASERIKNFPFPRQYASTALWMTLLFSLFVPFGMLSTVLETKPTLFWLSAPLSGFIIWVFFLMEKIGDYSENPFEGSYNDVPITSIARAIEIDLLEMIDEPNVPEPLKPRNGFLL